MRRRPRTSRKPRRAPAAGPEDRHARARRRRHATAATPAAAPAAAEEPAAAGGRQVGRRLAEAPVPGRHLGRLRRGRRHRHPGRRVRDERGRGRAGDRPPRAGSQSVKPVSADTSGSYNDLVQRANGLYDQGATAFDSEQYDQGSAYFAAAAKVYAAAWKQQSTDPGVGTDFATSLFYSGQIEPALSRSSSVLAKSPEFQTAWFNKGNYLAEKARQAEQDGDAKVAKAAYADARVAYEKAVALGADDAFGPAGPAAPGRAAPVGRERRRTAAQQRV